MSKIPIGVGFLLAMISFAGADVLVKCCDHSHVLGDNLQQCELRFDNSTRHRFDFFKDAINVTADYVATCFEGIDNTSLTIGTSNSIASITTCTDFLKNGSVVSANCSNIVGNPASEKCGSIFMPFNMYGVPMVIFSNVVHIFLYLLVLFMYMLMPHLCRRAYDKAVLSFAVTQFTMNILIVTFGYHGLCHIKRSKFVFSLLGVAIATFVTSGVLWLLIIIIDVASTITRLRWVPFSSAKGREENHKFRVYLSWATIGTLIPTAITAILEFSPLPEDHILKPQFSLLTSVNYRAIVHICSTPVLGAIASNALFIYTTVRMIIIRRSTNVANENWKKSIKEKYILYLKLYLLMDAPYITGALSAIYENLWMLNFFRLVQPIMMLYAVVPKKTQAKCVSCRKKGRKKKTQQALLKNYQPC